MYLCCISTSVLIFESGKLLLKSCKIGLYSWYCIYVVCLIISVYRLQCSCLQFVFNWGKGCSKAMFIFRAHCKRDLFMQAQLPLKLDANQCRLLGWAGSIGQVGGLCEEAAFKKAFENIFRYFLIGFLEYTRKLKHQTTDGSCQEQEQRSFQVWRQRNDIFQMAFGWRTFDVHSDSFRIHPTPSYSSVFWEGRPPPNGVHMYAAWCRLHNGNEQHHLTHLIICFWSRSFPLRMKKDFWKNPAKAFEQEGPMEKAMRAYRKRTGKPMHLALPFGRIQRHQNTVASTPTQVFVQWGIVPKMNLISGWSMIFNIWYRIQYDMTCYRKDAYNTTYAVYHRFCCFWKSDQQCGLLKAGGWCSSSRIMFHVLSLCKHIYQSESNSMKILWPTVVCNRYCFNNFSGTTSRIIKHTASSVDPPFLRFWISSLWIYCTSSNCNGLRVHPRSSSLR